MIELRLLVLSYNQIKFIPESIATLLFLEDFFIDHNQLEDLHSCVGDLVSLRHLDVSSNQVPSERLILRCARSMRWSKSSDIAIT